jgi:hypothetical protein
MRLLAAALFAIACIAAGEAHAANPYEVFRLGMSEEEAVAAAKEHGGDIFDVYEREGEKPGDIPMEPYQATGMFVFEHDRLKQMRFDYYLQQDQTPPGICGSIAEQAKKEISEVYGSPSESQGFSGSETELRGKITWWNVEGLLIDIFMADAPPLSSPGSCDIIWTELFDGKAEELEAFGARQQEAIRKSGK